MDILKSSGEQSMTVKEMERLFKQRTGRSFSTLHDIVKETEYGSHGIEDFVNNDSKILQEHDLVVCATFAITRHHFSHELQPTVLDLSNTRITSCRDLVAKCLQERNASAAVLMQKEHHP